MRYVFFYKNIVFVKKVLTRLKNNHGKLILKGIYISRRELKLILPNNNYKIQYLEMIQECTRDIKARRSECCVLLSTKETIYIDIEILNERHGVLISVKIILNNGGIFDFEDFYNYEKFQRYYIKL